MTILQRTGIWRLIVLAAFCASTVVCTASPQQPAGAPKLERPDAMIATLSKLPDWGVPERRRITVPKNRIDDIHRAIAPISSSKVEIRDHIHRLIAVIEYRYKDGKALRVYVR